MQTCGQPRGVFPKPFNYTQDHMDGSEWDYDYDFQCYFLYQHRAELYHWIDYRCEQMLAGKLYMVEHFCQLARSQIFPCACTKIGISGM